MRELDKGGPSMDTRAVFAKTQPSLWPSPLIDWLALASPEECFRINLKMLGRSLDLPLESILPPFIQAAHDGVFTLSWEYHCPHCHAIPDFQHNLRSTHSESDCPLCNVQFRNTLDENVEVTFTIHESIASLPKNVIDDWKRAMYGAAEAHNYAMPALYLSGLDCLSHPLFHQLFGDDVLSSDESLDIKRITLLFSDIKGSTKMYSDHGDTRSYTIVREHFKILFHSIEKHGGTVVKTIGDAVMAVFITPDKGMKAAIEAWQRFAKRSWDGIGQLEIKMGLHAGSAIAVNLDQRMDYFGNTVNMAARIQGLADDHTICFTQSILDDPGASAVLKELQRERGIKVLRRQAKLKGIGETAYYRIATP